jgi:glycosyltransferase involved in cell wall biosynthesis
MPSLNEALPNVLLESMAAAAPVVATRVGGTPEAVQDGVTGMLVPPGDPRALARAIHQLLADPELAARLGQGGRHRVCRRFSMDAMVQATERLYHSLLENRRRVSTVTPAGLACK